MDVRGLTIDCFLQIKLSFTFLPFAITAILQCSPSISLLTEVDIVKEVANNRWLYELYTVFRVPNLLLLVLAVV
uniref:Uncharacterized protein n=1 Tax=Arundo donax TaxID=35708 RepID=A0A0A9BXJ5_ARUDO